MNCSLVVQQRGCAEAPTNARGVVLGMERRMEEERGGGRARDQESKEERAQERWRGERMELQRVR